ncbi:MAG: SPASM domain-containing protein [Thermoplasmata archaeon]
MTPQMAHPNGQIEITVGKVCPINCAPHCPQLKFRKAYVERYGPMAPPVLSLKAFDRAIESIPEEVDVCLAGFSDPSMNTSCLDMMAHAKSRGHRVALFSTLAYFRVEDVARLREIDPDEFVPHLPDNLGIAHIPLTPTYKEVLPLVLSTVKVTGFSQMDAPFVSNQRAGNCDGAPALHVRGPISCKKLDRPEFVLLPNGCAVLCCMDWGIEHEVGNLLPYRKWDAATRTYANEETPAQTWNELVNGEEYRRVRRESWRLDGSSLCRSCTWAQSIVSPWFLKQTMEKAIEKVRA